MIIKFHFHPHTDTLQTPLELNILKKEENKVNGKYSWLFPINIMSVTINISTDILCIEKGGLRCKHKDQSML